MENFEDIIRIKNNKIHTLNCRVVDLEIKIEKLEDILANREKFINWVMDKNPDMAAEYLGDKKK